MTVSKMAGFKSYLFKFARLTGGALLLALAFISVDWPAVLEQFSVINPYFLLLAVVTVIGGLVLKIIRWQFLLRLTGIGLSNQAAASAFFLGQAANILLPFRGGEAVRLGMVIPQSKNRIPEAAASILLEKYFDLVALAISILIALAMISGQIAGIDANRIVMTAAVLTMGLIGFIWAGPWVWNRINGHRIFSRVPGWVDWVNRILACLQWIKSPTQVLPVALITIVIWMIMGLTNYVLFFSFGLPLNGQVALTVLIYIYIGVIPALMPGNFGPFYFFAQLALQYYQVPLETGLAYAMVLHAIVTLPPLILGGVALLLSPHQKISLSRNSS